MREPFTLEGTHVRLEPLAPEHVDELVEAVGDDRDAYRYTWVPADRKSAMAYVEDAMAHAEAGDQVPFATRSVALGRIVGSTRFYELDRWDWATIDAAAPPEPLDNEVDLVSIGHTWLGPSGRRSPVNTEAKLLMLDYAFERWHARAVRIQTDARNDRSRTAITRIGCSLDGVLRSDRPAADGTVRDSAIFSMLATEWPAARLRLRDRLAR